MRLICDRPPFFARQRSGIAGISNHRGSQFQIVSGNTVAQPVTLATHINARQFPQRLFDRIGAQVDAPCRDDQTLSQGRFATS